MNESDQLPITTVLKIKPVPGRENDCLNWMRETADIASHFPGFINKNIFKSAEDENLLVNIFAFEHLNTLLDWENSEKLKEQIKKGNEFIESIAEKKQLSGLEFWFQDKNTTQQPPVKWKIVLVTVFVIFVLLNVLVPYLQKAFTVLGFPSLLKSLVGVFIMVCLMTYLIMPLLTKWLGRWLFI